MKKRYSNFLTPIQIGDIVLKNRMILAAGQPHHIQGGENYPTDIIFARYEAIARNQCAALTVTDLNFGGMGAMPKVDDPKKIEIEEGPEHSMSFDLSDGNCQNYICHLIDSIHYYGAKAISYLPGVRVDTPGGMHDPRNMPPQELDIYGDPIPREHRLGTMKDGKLIGDGGGMDLSIVDDAYCQKYYDKAVEYAVALKKLGFDMISVHCAYRGQMAAQLLSPLVNKRTDKYGGDIEGRSRFMIGLFAALKEALGQGFPLDAVISGAETFVPGGFGVQDCIGLAKLCRGKIDMLTIRHGEIDPQHPTGFTSTRFNPTPNLWVAEAMKANNPDVLVCCSAGFRDLNWNEMCIAENKCDAISMCRAWICESEYGKKAYEGRGEDVVPCIRCNKCHMPNASDYFRGVCSVNPRIGLEEKLERMSEKPIRSKQVAVVGGGPAGLQTAVLCAQRGHAVTLFEKDAALGGQMRHAEFASFKWPLDDYKNYMINQVYKHGVDVRLNTTVTRELLEDLGFEEVVIAIGPRFRHPNVPGDDGANVWFAEQVYGRDGALGQKICVIGGSETGTETGIYLAECGHETRVMCRSKRLAKDAAGAHYVSMVRDYFNATEGVEAITHIKQYLKFDEAGVHYLDFWGNEQLEPCDSIVLACGAEPRQQEVMALFSSNYNARFIGDCDRPASIQHANRAALGAAMNI